MQLNYLDELTPKQEQAIVALINEPSIEKAATRVGVGERTLYRWLSDPLFSSAYRSARREAFSQAIGLTQKYAPLAVNQLAKMVHDPSTPATARVTAAVALLRFSRESIELDDLAGRIEALERQARASNADDRRGGDGGGRGRGAGGGGGPRLGGGRDADDGDADRRGDGGGGGEEWDDDGVDRPGDDFGEDDGGAPKGAVP